MNPENPIDLALAYFSDGHLSKAEAVCQQILHAEPQQPHALRLMGAIAAQVDRHDLALDFMIQAATAKPDFAEAHHGCALAYQAMGHMDDAISCFQKAIALYDDNADFHYDLGNTYTTSGKLEDAADSYLNAVAQKPDFVQAWYNLGNVQIGMGQNQDAVNSYQNALSVTPDYPEALNNLGVAFKNLGRLTDAASALEKAISLSPDFTAAYDNLGTTLIDLGKAEDAVSYLQKAITIDPQYAAAHNNLGNAYAGLLKWEEAVDSYKVALSIRPDYALGHYNLGNAYKKLGHIDAAISCYQASIAIFPHPEPYTNLGILQRVAGQYEDSIESFENALKADPGFSLAHSNMGLSLQQIGRIDEAVNSFRRALALSPNDHQTHGNLVFALQFVPEIAGEVILQEAKRWDALHCPSADVSGYEVTPDPERRLRIGYVSADFRYHAVAFLLEPLLMGHNRDEVEIYCYSEVSKPDSFTERFMKHADVWRSTAGVSDEDMDTMIRNDAVDIIVECSGHTKNNRLLALSRKPAPILVNYFPMHGETTGMASFDYAFSEADLAPPGVSQQFSEKLVILENGSFVYLPNAAWPEVAPPRGPEDEPVFACVGAPSRIGDAAIDLWARLLEMVPDARILFKHPSFGDPGTLNIWKNKLGRLGEQAVFEDVAGGWGSHMDVYGRIDVILDTIPISGGTSCVIPLWMGVPVVTQESQSIRQRFGLSMLNKSGAAEFIATDSDDYLKIASELVSDRDRLSLFRRDQRKIMKTAPICDARRVAGGIESAFRSMWRTWCAAQINENKR